MGAESRLLFLSQLRHGRTAEVGWSRFVERYSGLLLQQANQYAAGRDEVQDLYLYVCQKLAENDFRRLRGFKRGGEAEFAGWLRAVARNLCIDYLRSERGRRRLPRAVARLAERDQKVFELVYWDGFSVSEAFETLSAAHSDLRFSDVLASLDRVQQSLRPWQLGQIADSQARRESLPADEILARIPNGRPNPETHTELKLRLEDLRQELAGLPAPERLLLRLRFEQGLTLQQIAAASGLDDHRKVHERIADTLKRLRKSLARRGWG